MRKKQHNTNYIDKKITSYVR